MKRLRAFLCNNSDTSQTMEILRENWNRLAAREADVRTQIENDELQPGKRRREEVVNWLKTVEVQKGEVESIEKDCQQQVTSSRSQIVGRIERATEHVKDLIHRGGFTNGVVLDDQNSRAVSFPMAGFVGEMFHQNFETIMKWLKDGKTFLIGVHGMGGAGKTTLLKYLHNHLLHGGDIVERVHWVTVSQDCSSYKLQHKILRAVCDLKDFDEEDEAKRAQRLNHMLTKMGKTLLILDDVWDPYTLEEIGIPLGESGCKIILSTRRLDVCRRMGCEEFILKVEPLSTDEAWKLFEEKLQNYEALATEVKPIVKLIANECCCLPLAIITVAVSMRGVLDMAEWENALNELKNPSRRQDNANNDIFEKLRFSYDRLSDEMMQKCFLSCVLYREDCNIERKELIELWIAEGLLKSMGGWEEQVNKGHTILNKLVKSCLLEQSFTFLKRCVKMHDLIRDMGIMITQSHPRFMAKAGLLLKQVPEEEQWTEDLVKVSLRGNKITEIVMPNSPMCSKLSVFMLCDNPLEKIPESFFIHMRSLTVIDLSYTCIERLPESICGLENLRGLFLKCCEELINVPSLSKLTKLTLLDLRHSDKIREAPSGMENLKCLKKVNCMWNFDDDNYFNRMGEHFSELISYEFFLYRAPTRATAFFRQLDSDESEFEKRVIIIGTKSGFEHAVSTLLLPRTVECLVIEGRIMKRKEYSLGDMLPLLSQATELKLLRIRDCDGMGYIFCNTNIIDTLECLLLDSLPDLKGLIQLGGESNSCLASSFPRYGHPFSHLKKLIIWECKKMKVVFPHKFLQQPPCLPNLEEIQVCACDGVEEIFESYSETTNDVHNMSLILKLPKLNRLKLRWLPKLRSIYKGGLICTPLKTIDCCNSLPKFGRIYWGKCLMWDDSLNNNKRLWQHLEQDYPEDALLLSSWMIQHTNPFIYSWPKQSHSLELFPDLA